MEQGLKHSLSRLGLRQRELAALLDVSPRTVSMWASDKAAVPGPALAYLRVISSLSSDQLRGELSRLPGRSQAFDQGMYQFTYIVPTDAELETNTALCVLRNGKIRGGDPWGGVYSGTYTFSATSQKTVVQMQLHIPSGGTLITGQSVGDDGAKFELSGTFARPQPQAKSRVKFEGIPVDIVLTYLGPLPE